MPGHHICEYLLQATSAPHLSNSGPLFIYEHRQWSAAEAWQRVVETATQLENQCNVQVGDRVCILGLANPSTLEAVLAITAIGAIATPLNTRWTANEAAQAIDIVQPSTLLVVTSSSSSSSSNTTSLLDIAIKAATLSSPTIHTLAVLAEEDDRGSNDLHDKLQQLQSQQHRHGQRQKTLLRLLRQNNTRLIIPTTPTNITLKHAPQDAACIIFTSGTTGPPKAAVLTHTALHFQCRQKRNICGYSSTDIYLHTSPLYHVGGLCSALAMMLVGAKHVFLPSSNSSGGSFSGSSVVKAVMEYNVTSFIAVPTMIADILTSSSTTLPTVATIVIGAGGLHPTLLQQCISLFPNATLYSAYGMTEATSSLTFTTLHTPLSTTSTKNKRHIPLPSASPLLPPSTIQGAAVYVGQPPPGIELAILSTDLDTSIVSSSVLPKYENVLKKGCGEVLTRGPHVMSHYYNNMDGTKTVFLPGTTWLRTGDLGYIDTTTSTSTTTIHTTNSTTHLWLIGRVKDVVKTGGENVNVSEVERTLLHHTAVTAVCVVGVPDVRLGEVVAAVVVVDGGGGWRWRGKELQVLSPTAGSGSSSNGRSHIGNPNDDRYYWKDHNVDNHTSTTTSTTNEKYVDAYMLQQYCRQQV